jgi:hypothetical protein
VRGQVTFVLTLIVVILIVLSCAWGQLAITPTTTLAAQISNNTSAASTFVSQLNGNLGATNISKIDVHSLLYPGARTKVFAHLVLWFGQSDHMNVGYNSANPTQIARQINDMISRGIEGVVMVWYGPNNAIDKAAQAVMHEAENHPGFTFVIMVDHGAVLWDSCAGCAPQQALTAQMQYLEQTYFPSPAYLRWEGRPVVTNFDIDLCYHIDWNALSSALPSNPQFLFQNGQGFTHAVTAGAYSWVMPTASNFGLNYLSGFYSAGLLHPSLDTVGAAYKGFNDTLASWGMNRTMSEQCGQTWLQTFSFINALYNSVNQLPYLQLVTWNDYEEGTEIESGVDNCASVSASVAGNSLKWSLGGNESTIDHYNIYISADGQNLMSLAEQPVWSQTLDLCSYALAPANYTLYVQAVGKPVIANHMSSALSYSPSCGGSRPSAIAMAASPTSLTIRRGQGGNLVVSIKPQGGAFNEIVTLSCAAPAAISCQLSPSTLMPGSKIATSIVTVSAIPLSGRLNPSSPKTIGLALYSWIGPFAFAGLIATRADRNRGNRSVLAGLLVIGVLFVVSCGGALNSSSSHNSTSTVPSETYTIAITGNATHAQASAQATIVVR